MHSIFTIVKKELKRSFTDIRVLLGMILPGIIIFLMYSLMGSIISGAVDKQTSYTSFIVRVENCPQDENKVFENFFKANEYEVTDLYTDTTNNTTISDDEFKDRISKKEADMLVIYPTNFLDAAKAHKDDSSNPAPNVEIYFNSSRDESMMIYQEYTYFLSDYEASECNMFDVNGDTSKIYDLTNKDDSSRKFLSMMLPFILVIFIFSGALSFCADSFAGEKERGTMATLLMTPTKRSHIAIGKIIALSVMALVSATASFIGILFSLPKMLGSASSQFNFNVYGAGTYILLFLVIISLTLLFIAILAIISAYAKSVKEASSLSLPIMILVMLIGLSSFMSSGSASNPVYYLIPIYNAVQVLTGLLSGSMNTICLLVAVGANIVYVGIIVFLLTRMLNSERIMFKK